MRPADGAEPPYPYRVLGLLDAAGDRTVFEHGPRRVGGRELLHLVRRVSAGLRAAGIGRGDGLAGYLGVTPEAFAAIMAAHVVGARVTGVRPGLTAGQLGHVLGHDLAALLVDPSTATGPVRAAAGSLPMLAVGRVPGLPDLTAAPDDGAAPEPVGRPGDIARIIATSGSTGNPKGCAQTYAALGAGWAARPAQWPAPVRDLAAGLDRYLVFGSLASQVMLEYGVLTLAAGGTMVVAEPSGAGPFLPSAIAEHRATASVITVPRLYQLVRQRRTAPAPLSTLRRLLVSGSPLPPGRLAEALDVLGPVVFHGYGQTETGMISMVTPAELAVSPAALASVGRPPAAVAVEIRGADGRPVPTGVDGELFVRTPSQASGYWGEPAETAEVFVDGWVRTRDLGHRDADGYLYLTGRTREVVIVNANLHYTGPIERAMAGDRGVAEAYVVGAPDDRTGEAVHAFVVPVAGAVPDAARLRALVAGVCGEACVPSTITVIEEVPVAASGKPDKRRLAAMAADRAAPASATAP